MKTLWKPSENVVKTWWFFQHHRHVGHEKWPPMKRFSGLYDFWRKGKRWHYDLFLDFWSKMTFVNLGKWFCITKLRSCKIVTFEELGFGAEVWSRLLTTALLFVTESINFNDTGVWSRPLTIALLFVAESINFIFTGDVLPVNVLTRAERSIEGVSFVRRCRGQDAHWSLLWI